MLKLEGYININLLYVSDRSKVYEGILEFGQKKVILKTPSKELPSDKDISRLKKEYHILKDLDIDGIPKVYELIHKDSSYILVREYFEEQPLSHYFEKQTLTQESIFTIALNICNILQSIHEKGYIYQDINPNNILCDVSFTKIILIDFDSALHLPRLHNDGISYKDIEATLSYMSPEQTGRMNRSFDYRTDFYSLGVTLYEALAKRKPFETEDLNELIHSHIALNPKPLCEINTNLSLPLSHIISKLMAKDANDRYQSGLGIKTDLQKAYNLLLENKAFVPFALGENDLKDSFIIPETIYGREKEVKLLNQCFTASLDTQSQVLLITGESGIGKTSLVKELQKSVALKNGYMVSGKYDQYNRNRPYSAIIEALTMLLQKILGETKQQIENWKSKILIELDGQAQYIIDVIPELKLILGEQPRIPQTEQIEAKTIFHRLFQKFISLFGSQEHPFVLFLDDLQWIDDSSLKLLKTIALSPNLDSVMIIGAYRNNEVSKSHPLTITLDEIKSKYVKLSEIYLEYLSVDNVRDMLKDILNLEETKIVDFAQILHKKTNGNPLFIKTILYDLYKNHQISFNYNSNCWEWNDTAITQLSYSNNVIDVMQKNIQKLPKETLDILKLCACIGNPFEFKILLLIASNQDKTYIAKTLRPAIIEGHIVPTQADFELFGLDETDDNQQISFEFAHDKIQQVVYTSLSEKEKPHLHLKIASFMMEYYNSQEIENMLFDIVGHFNKALHLLTKQQKYDVVTLNIKAIKKAKQSIAFLDAVHFAQHAKDCLDENSWENQYESTINVYLELVESLYLTAQYEEADKLYTYIKSQIENDSDLLTMYNIQSKQYHHQGHFKEAVEIGYKAMTLLGITLPKIQNELEVLFSEEQTKIDKELQTISIEALYHKKDTQDTKLIQTLEIMFDMFVDGYLLGNSALITAISAMMARISIENKNNKMSSIAYINYASTLCAIGDDYQRGHEFGTLAVNLSQKYEVAALQNYTYHVFALSTNHWLKPLHTSYQYWNDASKLSLASGSPYSGYVFLQLPHILLASGSPLLEVEQHAQKSMQFLAESGLDLIALLLKLIVIQPIKNMRGETQSTSSFDSDDFLSKNFLEEFEEAAFFMGSYQYSQLRSKLIFEDYLSVSEANQYMTLIDVTQPGQIIISDSLFYVLLHLCTAYEKLTNKKEKESCLESINIGLTRLEKWSNLCDKNFEHKFLLIQAELKSINNEFEKAIAFYDAAIESAKLNNFLHHTALCYERAARYCEKTNKKNFTSLYIHKALHAYDRWGASEKVKQLQKKYAQLLESTQKISTYTNTQNIELNTTYADISTLSDNLDLLSVIKASQAISKHIIIEDIAKVLTTIAVENIGASKGFLILKETNNFYIKCMINKDETHNLTAQWFKEGTLYTQEITLSNKIINYVINTNENIILDNLSESTQFKEEGKSYTAKSVCCIPIINKNNLNGVLYLENSETYGAFKKKNIDILDILVTQAAISLENSQIYIDLENLNKNLESLVNQRTKELHSKNQILLEQNEELEYLSTTDLLTNIYNRRYLEEKASKEILRCKRYGAELSIILIDVDKFKLVNDNYGHNVGDEILILIAETLKNNIRVSDTLGRWGGEEFLVIVPTPLEDTIDLANKLRKKIENITHPQINKITISAGVSKLESIDTLSSLVNKADQGLYLAKENGRNRVEVIM